MSEVVQMTEEQIRALARLLCENVDHGCPKCAWQAIECWLSLFPEWAPVMYEEYMTYWNAE